MRLLATVFLALVLLTAMAHADDTPTQKNTTAHDKQSMDSKEKTKNMSEDELRDKMRMWAVQGQDAVKMRLRDPDSAQFDLVNIKLAWGPGGALMVCGAVSAKNGFGGYNGKELFISTGEPAGTYLQSEVQGFKKVWAEFCESRHNSEAIEKYGPAAKIAPIRLVDLYRHPTAEESK